MRFFTLFFCGLLFASCSKRAYHFSDLEQAALSTSPFNTGGNNGGDTPTGFNPEDVMTGVDSKQDALVPSNGLVSKAAERLKFVRNCTEEDYEAEKQAALEEALADENFETIVVRYAVSVGSALDKAAKYAQERAILRASDDGKTPYYVAPADKFDSNYYHGKYSYIYFTDHKKARDEYKSGERCFFSTVKIYDTQTGSGLAGSHDERILYYGDSYTGTRGPLGNLLSPRLFQNNKETLSVCKETPEKCQIPPLYVADFREELVNPKGNLPSIMNPNFDSSAIRRREYLVSYKTIFFLKNLFTHRYQVEKNLVTKCPSRECKKAFDEGFKQEVLDLTASQQLIQNIINSVQSKAIVLSTQYTPLVLDLGKKSIRTSSVERSPSFFNLGNFKVEGSEATPHSISHRTAWVGGTYFDYGNRASNAVITKEDSADNFDWRVKADDGFLVYLNDKDEVYNSSQLFGNEIEIDGKKYDNGFEALRALAGKDCNSDDIKSRYLGPWDEKVYSKLLRVWVDENRNGISEKEELKTLADHQILAMNTCNIIHDEESDRFGNQTKLRAAFLVGEFTDARATEEDIIHRLKTGKYLNRDDRDAQFRVMIDIYFKAKAAHYLEDIDPKQVSPSLD